MAIDNYKIESYNIYKVSYLLTLNNWRTKALFMEILRLYYYTCKYSYNYQQ